MATDRTDRIDMTGLSGKDLMLANQINNLLFDANDATRRLQVLVAKPDQTPMQLAWELPTAVKRQITTAHATVYAAKVVEAVTAGTPFRDAVQGQVERAAKRIGALSNCIMSGVSADDSRTHEAAGAREFLQAVRSGGFTLSLADLI